MNTHLERTYSLYPLHIQWTCAASPPCMAKVMSKLAGQDIFGIDISTVVLSLAKIKLDEVG